MQAFTTVTGPAAPLLRSNIDTDTIIRIERLTQLPRGELGPYALEALHGPDFVLHHKQFRGAPILLAGDNFGCGSSREGAVWALGEIGIRCVIAPSFGDIFFSNCFQNGMLPVVLPASAVALLAVQAAAGAPVTVSLEDCRVTAPGGEVFAFDIDPVRREMLLAGLDELDWTLLRVSQIAAWHEADILRRPWAVPPRSPLSA